MININSPEDLKKLSYAEKTEYAEYLRKTIVNTVSQNGGHLSSNLGVVELTIALHSVFNSPKDKIIWDVSHQAYSHKLITGRRDRFDTIRKPKGISGFTNAEESPHDSFTFGHAGSSISAAMGLAKANQLNGNEGHVIAVIGDGSIGNGLCFEAINNLSASHTNLIIVLNDNKMSISKNVGAFAMHLTKLRLKKKLAKSYRDIHSILRRFPGGEFVYSAIKGITNGFIRLFQSQQGVFFEEMGISYFGPYDGHNIAELEEAFRSAKRISGGVLIHIITSKGHGYKPAEEHPDKFHGVGAFEKSTGQTIGKSSQSSFTKIFSDKITELANKDDKITAITAGMSDGTGLKAFSEQFPKRFFDVGISEGHAVTFAAGLAKGGRKPITAIYSTFLQRAYDNISHDVCLQKLPVIFAIDRAGLVGNDGPTHHGVFDIAYLRHLPNITMSAPRNGVILDNLLELAFEDFKAAAIRYPRGSAPIPYNEEKNIPFIPYQAQKLKEGTDAVFIAVGPMVYTALETAAILEKENIHLQVWDPIFIKPICSKMLMELCSQKLNIFTVEDGIKKGGFGSALEEELTERNCGYLLKKSFGIPDYFVPHGSVDYLREQLGLTPRQLAKSIKEKLTNTPC